MRLSPQDRQTIKQHVTATLGPEAQVRLFGLRLKWKRELDGRKVDVQLRTGVAL